MRRVSVGIRGFSGMPEEAVTFTRASCAIKTSSWAPSWAAVPTVFYRWHHDYRVAFGKDAFSMSVAPAVEEMGEAMRYFIQKLYAKKWKWKEWILTNVSNYWCIWSSLQHHLSPNRTATKIICYREDLDSDWLCKYTVHSLDHSFNKYLSNATPYCIIIVSLFLSGLD